MRTTVFKIAQPYTVGVFSLKGVHKNFRSLQILAKHLQIKAVTQTRSKKRNRQ